MFEKFRLVQKTIACTGGSGAVVDGGPESDQHKSTIRKGAGVELVVDDSPSRPRQWREARVCSQNVMTNGAVGAGNRCLERLAFQQRRNVALFLLLHIADLLDDAADLFFGAGLA